MKSVRTLVVLVAGGLVMMMALSLAVSAYRVAGTRPATGVGVGAGSGADKADDAMTTIRPEAIRADMRFLSDDLLEGRGTGTRGYEIAAKFMTTQFEGMGLTGAGDAGSYFQQVPLRSMRVDADKSSMSLVRDGKDRVLTFKKEFIMHGDPGRAETS